jgi:hypothetical protein
MLSERSRFQKKALKEIHSIIKQGDLAVNIAWDSYNNRGLDFPHTESNHGIQHWKTSTKCGVQEALIISSSDEIDER